MLHWMKHRTRYVLGKPTGIQMRRWYLRWGLRVECAIWDRWHRLREALGFPRRF